MVTYFYWSPKNFQADVFWVAQGQQENELLVEMRMFWRVSGYTLIR